MSLAFVSDVRSLPSEYDLQPSESNESLLLLTGPTVNKLVDMQLSDRLDSLQACFLNHCIATRQEEFVLWDFVITS
jgi:hypothetical protein